MTLVGTSEKILSEVFSKTELVLGETSADG